MKTLILSIREQQLAVERLIAKCQQEGGDDMFLSDDMFLVMAEFERKNAELSAAVAKHIADSAPKPEPVVTPFDPTLAPPGCKAVPAGSERVNPSGCSGCVFELESSVGCCNNRPCTKDDRPDRTDVIFVEKETP